MNSLRQLLRSRKQQKTIELQPLHQRLLHCLGKFGPTSFDRLSTYATVEHPAPAGEVLLALVKLEHDGLVNRLQGSGENRASSTYRLSDRGKRVERWLPPQSSSSIDIRD
jgi:hypothetical protein